MKNLLSVRCLMIDFSKALDRVSHPILLSKLSKLELLDRAINWIISYLTGRTHVVKCNGGGISLPANSAYSKRVPRTNCALRIKKCAPRISSGIYFLSTS